MATQSSRPSNKQDDNQIIKANTDSTSNVAPNATCSSLDAPVISDVSASAVNNPSAIASPPPEPVIVLDLGEAFEIEECTNSAAASLSDIHECFERGEPLSLLILSRLSDRDLCESLLEDWLQDDVLPIANIKSTSPDATTWAKQLVAHFQHAASLGLSAIEYRLWSMESNVIKVDARLLRYTAQQSLLEASSKKCFWE